MDVADVEYLKLTEYVGVDTSYAEPYIDQDRMQPLVNLVERADGLILGSPVYFGDRSSLMHSFINFAADNDLLNGKVVGTVSVGSKRNGGQETANVYALFENLNHGAYIVGNGPKTCQYGGTGWAGDIGDVADDNFGLETSLGTGLRVSSVAQLRKLTSEVTHEEVDNRLNEPLDIGVIIPRDKDGLVRSTIERRLGKIDDEMFRFNVTEFSQSFIQACIGCDVCPTPAKVEEISGDGSDYKCIIDDELDEERWADDELQDLHDDLMKNEALVIGVLDSDETGIDDVYQALLERTRYIRRDDWRLHNVPLAAYVVKPPNRSSTYPMKIMTSWMRHNTIVHEPIVHTKFGSDVPVDDKQLAALEDHYNRSAQESIESFVESAKQFRAAARMTGSDKLSYKATGYRNKILDDTVAERI